MTTEILPLVYFSHAELKSSENLTASFELVTSPTSKQHSGSFTSNKISSGNKKLKLLISDMHMNYEALEDDDQPFLVASLDRASNSLSIFKTACFTVKPECYLHGSSSFTENAASKSSFSEKLDSLTAAFGSSKKRKAMQTKIKNRLDSRTLETAVSAAVSESKKSIEETTAAADENAASVGQLEQYSVLPTPNKAAKSPVEVYDLHELLCVSEAEFDRFTMEQSAKFAMSPPETIKKWKEQSVYSDYVTEHLINYANAKYNHQYKLQKCRQLAYVHFLLSLYRLKANQLRTKKSIQACEVPDAVAAKLFDLYTCVSNANAYAKSVRTMPRRLKDKLTCHILVLALHVDDFASGGLETFQRDLKLSVPKLTEFYQALGCFVKSVASSVNGKRVVSKRAVLTLPLNENKPFEAKKKLRKS